MAKNQYHSILMEDTESNVNIVNDHESLFSTLPYYIYDELVLNIHNDNFAFKDFLEILNKPIVKLQKKVIENQYLIYHNKNNNNELNSFINSLSCSYYHENLMALCFGLRLGGTKNLAFIKKLINIIFKLNISIFIQQQRKMLIPKNAITQLSSKNKINNRLGYSFILGHTCIHNFSKIMININIKKESEFNQLKNNNNLLDDIYKTVNFLINEYIPVDIFLNCHKKYIKSPIISTDNKFASTLGQMNYFSIKNKNVKKIDILVKSF